MRLIDADEMIKGLSKFTTCKLGEIKAVDIKKFINEQSTVNKWIPCSERLPESYNFQKENVLDIPEYLICRKDRKYDIAKYGKIYKDGFYAHGVRIKDVIAWQPLPQPYTIGERKEDDEDE